MDFGVSGRPTPRADGRILPGGGTRPQSGRTSRNPITGAEMEVRPSPRVADTKLAPETRPHGRPQGVPGLNLKYIADEDNKPSKPINVYEYSLQTPDSASTVSWGTGRSNYSQRLESKNPTPRASNRPQGVPGLTLGDSENNKKPVSARPKPKEPSAWDKPAVSEDVRPPSVRYQQMYKQYENDMKQSYRQHVQPPYNISESEVVEKVKQTKQTLSCNQQTEEEEEGPDYNEDDVSLQDKWLQQRYSNKQLMKKMDAEDLLEYNKKQKLIETVLADQLSRAVISDPEQNQRNSTYEARRGRGSNRFLHDSKVRTRTTATENLLSKRVQFGARIITRDGHDALRELTGFFFDVDNTLTIYEFKQFGKSAKAIPFINRGQFCHVKGSRKDQPYTVLDIYSGSTLVLPTKKQHCIPATMKGDPYMKVRIINVDDEEKTALLGSSRGQETYARHQFPCKEDYENQKMLAAVQDTVRDKLRKRGIKTVTGLGRWYRHLDQDTTGLLTHHELEQGLIRYHVDLNQEILEAIVEILDPDNEGNIDYSDYMRAVVGEMNEYRKSLVRKAFGKVDSGKKGVICLSDIRKFFNTTASARGPPGMSGTSAIQAFLEVVQASPKQEEISYVEFDNYYEGLSIGIEEDEDFANVLRNTWTI